MSIELIHLNKASWRKCKTITIPTTSDCTGISLRELRKRNDVALVTG